MPKELPEMGKVQFLNLLLPYFEASIDLYAFGYWWEGKQGDSRDAWMV